MSKPLAARLAQSRYAKSIPFAHLLGIAPAAEESDDKDDKDDDERKQKDGESDDDYAKRMKALDDKDKEDAEDEEKKEDAEADDDPDDMKAARATERARCAAIIAFGIQNDCVAQAGVLAFDTPRLSSAAAIAVLQANAAAGNKPRGRTSLDQRMANLRTPTPTPDAGVPEKTGASGAAQSIIAAYEAVRGK